MQGVTGSGLKLDGFTTCVTRKASDTPRLTNAFTVEAWIAIAAYPWNWCPIVSQQKEERTGYTFGIGPEGELGLQLSLDGIFYRAKWRVCTSEAKIPLKEWVHVAGIFNEQEGITIYLNGKETGKLALKGTMVFAPTMDLLIGMNHEKREPSHPHRQYSNLPAWYSFDGIIDEVKIFDRALTANELEQAYLSQKPASAPDLPPRVMPSGPPGNGRFGAYYHKLQYYEEWDALWRTGEYSDVVVQFDHSPIRVVFWRGTSYSPAWVMENGTWITDQSVEAWNGEGTFEHMNDARCLYSHVRIIESNDARVIVHWRYAPVNTRGHLWRVDEKTGRACWVDEYYTFYPDGVGTRKITWKKGSLGQTRQFQETLPLCHPGQRPEDILHLDALTLVNLKGETHTYSWPGDPDSRRNLLPDNPNIQLVNLKSKARPFIIFEPGTRIRVLGGTLRKGIFSEFPMANHWPVAQIPSDGRTSLAPDRASHFSPAISRPLTHEGVESTNHASWLCGTTERPAVELVTLARSWAQAPELRVRGNDFISEGYDSTQRAYVLTAKKADGNSALSFELLASEQSPIVNPAFVVKGWGPGDARLKVGDSEIRRGDVYRMGHRHTLKGSNLLVWTRKESKRPEAFSLLPA